MKLKYILTVIFALIFLFISLSYGISIDKFGKIHLNYYIFSIVLLCGCFIAYKLSERIVNLKTKSDISGEDLLFLIIFFILLCVPLSYIEKSDYSESENRFYEEYKNFIIENKLNYTYGTDFNKWFSDRFCLRQNLVHLYKYLIYQLSYRYVRYSYLTIDKQKNMIYSAWDVFQIAPDKIKKSIETLSEFNKFCKKNNIKLYVLVVPDKTSVYKINKINNPDRLKKSLDSRQDKDLNVIYPLNEFIDKSKRDNHFLFFKTEHHWTDDGAYLGYLSVMNEIKKDFPDVKTVPMDDFYEFYHKKVQADWNLNQFRNGITCLFMGIPDSICEKYLDVNYRYLRHKDEQNLKLTAIADIKNIRKKEFEYDKGANRKVIVLGTSMGENLVKFIPYSFKYTKRIRTNNVKDMPSEEEFKIIKYYKNEILDYKPDILIFCITYYNFGDLKDLFEEN